MALPAWRSGRPAVTAQSPSWRGDRLGRLSWRAKAFCNMQPLSAGSRNWWLRVWAVGQDPSQPSRDLHGVQARQVRASQAQAGKWHHEVCLPQMQGQQDRGRLSTSTTQDNGCRSEADLLSMLQSPRPIEVQPVREGEASGRLWRCDGHFAPICCCLQRLSAGGGKDSDSAVQRLVQVQRLSGAASYHHCFCRRWGQAPPLLELRVQKYQAEGRDDLPQQGLQAQVWGEASAGTASKALLSSVPSQGRLILKLMGRRGESWRQSAVLVSPKWACSNGAENKSAILFALHSVKPAIVAHGCMFEDLGSSLVGPHVL